ncbi:DUF11 domain-containing protein [Novilysobacter antarcticus]|uniref:DUF11 domain-containing protein n=1 Tax=Novilysobacter antarcticus TaxID=2862543 RepID=UPI001C997487|nr:DUF11 domain-containing protein [Lysobacter antarcticus]
MMTPRTPARRYQGWLLAGIAMLCVGTAAAAGGVELNAKVFQQVELRNADGSITLKAVPANVVIPGTEVTYVVTYRNTGATSADAVKIDNPVPTDLIYVASAGDRAVDAVSVDGGKQYGVLAGLTVVGEDDQSRPAQAGDVTHLRWVLGSLPAGAEGTVSFVAKVK